MTNNTGLHIAIVGSGAAGLSAAWLLAKRNKVTLLEKEHRLGGHAHTATIGESGLASDSRAVNGEAGVDKGLKIDTGFIVYNEPSYPNMTRWFDALNVATENSDMSFAVSRGNGSFEYAGGPALGLIAQPGLLLQKRFWHMIQDLLRFYKNAANDVAQDSSQTLGDFLQEHNYNEAFVQDHLLPFGAAIWSTSKSAMLDYPAAAFIRFCDNHGLLQISNRPQWRTVTGGSERYVQAVHDCIGTQSVQTGFNTQRIERTESGVVITDDQGQSLQADHVVIATHADQALALLDQPSAQESQYLSSFVYESNEAYLHTDISHLPKRRRAWCSWNYVEQLSDQSQQVSVSYWMNRLQNLRTDKNYIVTLNPERIPSADCVYRQQRYEHPVFTAATYAAQQHLWSLQGKQRTWFCGSYFGSGFHEDAVQSGLAVAEQLGGDARPWQLDNPSPRIVVPSTRMASYSSMAEVAA